MKLFCLWKMTVHDFFFFVPFRPKNFKIVKKKFF